MRPSFAMVLDWIDGRLDPITARAVESAVHTGGVDTQETVRWLRRFREVAEQFPLEDPPPIVAQRLQQYFEHRRPGAGRQPISPVELRAELVFDSRANRSLAGVRGAQAADDLVHVAYQTPRADLVVDISRLSPQLFRLDGQLLPIDPAGASVVEVVARVAGTKVRSVDGDALGRFTLPAVPGGPIELRASNGEYVVIAQLELGEPRADDPTGQPRPQP